VKTITIWRVRRRHEKHGFPNPGYSWRKVMPAIADAGYYVIAPDCRGYGRTVGWYRIALEPRWPGGDHEEREAKICPS